MSTRPWIVDDDLRALIEPLLPPWPEKSPGPQPVADRPYLQGILYVPHSDITLQLRPLEMELASGRTSWRRLERWQQDAVFDQPHRILLAEPTAAGELDWSRACVDGSRIRTKKGDADTGPAPVHRRQTCSNHHLICDGRGTPLKLLTTAANVNDVTQTLALLPGVPLAGIRPVTERPARPPRRPDSLLGDKGHDSNPNRREPRKRQILPVISRTDAPNIKAWANSTTSRRRPLPHSTHDRGTRTYGSFRACASQEPLHSPPLGAHADAVGSNHRSFRSSGEMHAGI
ncbi:transposase [Streptomyces sp. NBC_01239]|uniref:transposase n=1 Tax=Streptomyces sp. NBC_01239 TaxID=2903792 RepID=UPI002252D0F7|nr:transposase [Streptomyces sp. NBC_01239]MCX4815669.1 transposase [Streptomyces sp. NBC_01239]